MRGEAAVSFGRDGKVRQAALSEHEVVGCGALVAPGHGRPGSRSLAPVPARRGDLQAQIAHGIA